MIHVSDRFTAILDANVLYPFLVRDVLLTFAYAGLYRARWSLDIMDEWTRHLIENRPDKEEQIRRTASVMSEEFPEALVEGYDALLPSLELPDPNDRHVLAAAIKCGAHAIVTNNTRDFRPEFLSPYDMELVTPDAFTLNTFELYPMETVSALRTMRQRYDNPSYTPSELILSLTKAGLVQLATELRQHIDIL